MRTLYIFDLDGVLFDNHHREDLIPEDKSRTENWAAFNSQSLYDAPIGHMWAMLQELVLSGADVAFLTGRSADCRFETVASIVNQLIRLSPLTTRTQANASTITDELINLVNQRLFMRAQDDHRSAATVKAAWFTSNTARGDLYARLGSFPRVVLVEDDKSIIDACMATGWVTRAIHVEPFAGCIAYQGSKAPAADNLDDHQQCLHLMDNIDRINRFSWATHMVPTSVLHHYLLGDI